jgi:ribosome modulation factor
MRAGAEIIRARRTDISTETVTAMEQEAYDAGYEAYWEGADITDNPYDAEMEVDAVRSWQEGWRQACAHDYDESDG